MRSAATSKPKPSQRVVLAALAMAAGLSVARGALAGIGYGDSPAFDLDTTALPDETHLEGYILDSINSHKIRYARVSLVGNGFNETYTTGKSGHYAFHDIGQTDQSADYYLSVVHEFAGSECPDQTCSGYEAINQKVVTLAKGVMNQEDCYLETRTVVLLHGALSYGGIWSMPLQPDGSSSFLANLRAAPGFYVPAPIDFSNPRGSLSNSANDLKSWLEAHLHVTKGIQSYSVVGHSAGGLIARLYASSEEEAEAQGGHYTRRFKDLVTLGTPHHGAAIGSLVQSFPNNTSINLKLLSWYCDTIDTYQAEACVADLAACEILKDLVPGSEPLNMLNYREHHDELDADECSTHAAEYTAWPPPSRICSIAGTDKSWWLPDGSICCGYGDGTVAVNSARYWASDNWYTDEDLSLSVGHCDLTSSEGIADAVKSVLEGNPPPYPRDLAGNDVDREEGPRTVLLPVLEAEIEPGGSFEGSAIVNALSQATFACLWSGDSLGFRLRTPSGVLVDPAYADTSSSVTYFADPVHASYVLLDPEAGPWLCDVTGGLDTVSDSVLVLVSVDSEIALSAGASALVRPDESFMCTAVFTSEGSAIPAAVVEAHAINPDGSDGTVALLDNGVLPDLAAGDGVYTATYPASGLSGTFAFSMTGIVDAGDPLSGRYQEFAVGVSALRPDIAISPDSLRIGEAIGNHGIVDYLDEVTIAASFQNLGEGLMDSVRLRVEDLNAGEAVIDSIVSMSAGEVVNLQTTWVAARHDTTWFRANSISLGAVGDADLSNNSTIQWVRALIPGEPTSVPESAEDGPNAEDDSAGAAGGVILFQNYPNPFNPSTSITFRANAADTRVVIAIYDIAGRLVRTVLSGMVEKGVHTIEWRGDDESGERLPSGIYFCRMEIGNEIQTRKIALVK